MNLSAYWDIESNTGKLIVHRANEKVLELIAPTNTLPEFNEWVDKTSRYIQL